MSEKLVLYKHLTVSKLIEFLSKIDGNESVQVPDRSGFDDLEIMVQYTPGNGVTIESCADFLSWYAGDITLNDDETEVIGPMEVVD